MKASDLTFAVQTVLLDIEGTTTSIAFVKETLFPYARSRMKDFVRENVSEPVVRECLDSVRQTLRDEGQGDGDEQVISALQRWIDEDRKHTALKTLQGYLWKAGYERGDYTAHLYPDVPLHFEKWFRAGIGLAIYSSGSVAAQKLLFRHTTEGDMTRYFSGYFDTHTGGKRESASYERIWTSLGKPAEQILFLSDISEELDAARQAGMQTVQLVREGTEPCEGHIGVGSFGELDLKLVE